MRILKIFFILFYLNFSYADIHFFEAAEQGDLEYLKLVLEKNELSSLINEKNEKGKSALHLAAKNGHLKVVAFLIENGADMNLKDRKGDTPFHLACREKQASVIKFFIQQGVNAFIENYEGRIGFTELKMALRSNYQFRQDAKESLRILQGLKNTRALRRARDNRNAILNRMSKIPNRGR